MLTKSGSIYEMAATTVPARSEVDPGESTLAFAAQGVPASGEPAAAAAAAADLVRDAGPSEFPTEEGIYGNSPKPVKEKIY